MMMTMMMQGVRQRVEKLQGKPMAANTINHHRTRIGERSHEITQPPPPPPPPTSTRNKEQENTKPDKDDNNTTIISQSHKPQ